MLATKRNKHSPPASSRRWSGHGPYTSQRFLLTYMANISEYEIWRSRTTCFHTSSFLEKNRYLICRLICCCFRRNSCVSARQRLPRRYKSSEGMRAEAMSSMSSYCIRGPIKTAAATRAGSESHFSRKFFVHLMVVHACSQEFALVVIEKFICNCIIRSIIAYRTIMYK